MSARCQKRTSRFYQVRAIGRSARQHSSNVLPEPACVALSFGSSLRASVHPPSPYRVSITEPTARLRRMFIRPTSALDKLRSIKRLHQQSSIELVILPSSPLLTEAPYTITSLVRPSSEIGITRT